MHAQSCCKGRTFELQVHVGWLEGGTAILAFRGTQTAQDGLQDVKIVRQSIDHLQGMFPGTQAHSGDIHRQCLMYLCVGGGVGVGGTPYLSLSLNVMLHVLSVYIACVRQIPGLPL